MGLMVGKKMDSEIEENVIYHEELKKYTICCLEAVKHRSNQPGRHFHPMLDDLKTSSFRDV